MRASWAGPVDERWSGPRSVIGNAPGSTGQLCRGSCIPGGVPLPFFGQVRLFQAVAQSFAGKLLWKLNLSADYSDIKTCTRSLSGHIRASALRLYDQFTSFSRITCNGVSRNNPFRISNIRVNHGGRHLTPNLEGDGRLAGNPGGSPQPARQLQAAVAMQLTLGWTRFPRALQPRLDWFPLEA